jgi:hypothetical protein
MVRKLYRSNWVKYAQAIASALLATACAVTYTDARYPPEQVNRQVVDAATGRGLEAAFVVFEWDRQEVDIGHGSRVFCYRVEMTRTDTEGRYTIPTWEGRMGMIRTIYSRRFTRAHEPIAASKGIDKMKMGSEDFATRLAELRPLLIRCGEDEDRKLLEFYRALLDEARSLAKTDAERRQADSSFLWYVDAAQYGRDAAFRRSNEK